MAKGNDAFKQSGDTDRKRHDEQGVVSREEIKHVKDQEKRSSEEAGEVSDKLREIHGGYSHKRKPGATQRKKSLAEIATEQKQVGPFKPKLTKTESRQSQTDEAVHIILEQELSDMRKKTARLRAARLSRINEMQMSSSTHSG